MTKNPMIHVVIPVYNAVKYVALTLDSVLSQPYHNIHIVCVDDGSPDDSISILRDYEKRYKNIHVIRQANGGVSRARNTGIDYVLEHGSNEDFVAFLDADDCWVRDSVTPELVGSFGEADCIGFTSVCCSEDMSRAASVKPLSSELRSGGMKSRWCHSDYHFASMLYSCAMLKHYHIRFISGLSYSEDLLFRQCCIYLANQIRLIDQPLYLHRSNPAGAMRTRKYGIDHLSNIVRGYLKTEAFLRTYETPERKSPDYLLVMAAVYTLAMIEEHYSHFGSTSKLNRFLEQNPDFSTLLKQVDPVDMADSHRQMLQLYRTAPFRFRCRCYLTGLKDTFVNQLKAIPFLIGRVERNRFSMPNKYL